jgi:DNA (cytosine-5)-methyltransferase 1
MTAYYNENDPKAAAWLRKLIKNGDIANGEVDERSITEVQPSDLNGFTQIHLFAGVGGWSLALRIAGVPDDFPIWTGSCPCPPFSVAGKKKSCPECQSASLLPHPYRTGVFACCDCGHQWSADERHLWPEFHRLIQECRPAIVFGEQVAGADGELWLSGVRATLEILGYGVGAANIGAHSVGAYHQRQRLYWLADRNAIGLDSGSASTGCQTRERPWFNRSGATICMADTDGRNPGTERQQCCRKQRLHPEYGIAMQLGNTQSHDQFRYRQSGPSDGRQMPLGRSSSLIHLADTSSQVLPDGKFTFISGSRRQGQRRTALQPGCASTDIHLLEYTDNTGLQEQFRQHDQPARPATASGIEQQSTAWAPTDDNHMDWRTADWIYCRDDKWRPIEPGTFPLVDGLPKGVVHSGDPCAPIDADQTAEARVMRLRGYGNAIHPHLAAEFINLSFEAMEHAQCTLT